MASFGYQGSDLREIGAASDRRLARRGQTLQARTAATAAMIERARVENEQRQFEALARERQESTAYARRLDPELDTTRVAELKRARERLDEERADREYDVGTVRPLKEREAEANVGMAEDERGYARSRDQRAGERHTSDLETAGIARRGSEQAIEHGAQRHVREMEDADVTLAEKKATSRSRVDRANVENVEAGRQAPIATAQAQQNLDAPGLERRRGYTSVAAQGDVERYRAATEHGIGNREVAERALFQRAMEMAQAEGDPALAQTIFEALRDRGMVERATDERDLSRAARESDQNFARDTKAQTRNARLSATKEAVQAQVSVEVERALAEKRPIDAAKLRALIDQAFADSENEPDDLAPHMARGPEPKPMPEATPEEIADFQRRMDEGVPDDQKMFARRAPAAPPAESPAAAGARQYSAADRAREARERSGVSSPMPAPPPAPAPRGEPPSSASRQPSSPGLERRSAPGQQGVKVENVLARKDRERAAARQSIAPDFEKGWLEWASAQPPGSDTSLAAYMKWHNAQRAR